MKCTIVEGHDFVTKQEILIFRKILLTFFVEYSNIISFVTKYFRENKLFFSIAQQFSFTSM